MFLILFALCAARYSRAAAAVISVNILLCFNVKLLCYSASVLTACVFILPFILFPYKFAKIAQGVGGNNLQLIQTHSPLLELT